MNFFTSVNKTPQDLFEVVSTNRRGKKTVHEAYDDAAKARDHAKKLKDLYGDFLQVEVTKTDGSKSKLKHAVKRAKKILKDQ